MQIGNHRWIGKVFYVLDILMRWISLFIGAFSKANPSKFPEFFGSFLKSIQEGWVLPAVLILTPAAVWARHRTDKSRLEAVHELLDQICENTFANQDFEHEQNRRVTLFKFKKFNWRTWPFFGGWLIPIERSGDHTRYTSAIFRAPDDGKNCEGIAGRAWSKRANVYVQDLPNLRKNPTDEQMSEYAAKTFVKVESLRKKPPQACSLFGVPIEVGQKRWGVIVIDSVNTTIPCKAAKSCLKQIAPTLSSYLKGV